MPTSPPGPAARIAAASAEGDTAARTGRPVTACPYTLDRAPLRRQAWLLAYGRRRRLTNPDATPSARDETADPDAPPPAGAP